MSANIPKTTLLSDLLKSTGYNCPSELQDKTFDAATSGNGGGSSDPNLQDKTITSNGTYTADSGYDGLGEVTVNVSVSGGGGSSSDPVPYYYLQSPVNNAPRYLVTKDLGDEILEKYSSGETQWEIYETGALWCLSDTDNSVKKYVLADSSGSCYVEYNSAGLWIYAYGTFQLSSFTASSLKTIASAY